MKSTLLRNTIVTAALAIGMACAMPLSAAAQERDGNGRDGNDARYSQRDDSYRNQRDQSRDANDFRRDWRSSRDDSYRAPRERDGRDRNWDRGRGDDWQRSDFRHDRGEHIRDDGRRPSGVFFRVTIH